MSIICVSSLVAVVTSTSEASGSGSSTDELEDELGSKVIHVAKASLNERKHLSLVRHAGGGLPFITNSATRCEWHWQLPHISSHSIVQMRDREVGEVFLPWSLSIILPTIATQGSNGVGGSIGCSIGARRHLGARR